MRFDGWFVVAVTSTGIYCRPSCPAVTPRRANVRFYPTAAAAQLAGFRACMRCRPDATPGSPEWNSRADVVGRAMRLILDGMVDRVGVAGLAAELGYSQRQLHRLLVAEVGAGALALARSQRAQTARVLLETTSLPAAQVAFGAGFSSVRQFNDTVRQVFAMTPSGLRRNTSRIAAAHRAHPQFSSGAPAISVRLALRAPFDADALFTFLVGRCVPGVEAAADGAYWRTLRLHHGDGFARIAHDDRGIGATFWLADLRDLAPAVTRCRRLLDLDADPVAIVEALGPDPLIGPLVARSPGRRVAGAVDGAELAFRAVVGQQVSLASARAAAGRLVALAGRPMRQVSGAPDDASALTHLFPSPEELVAIDPVKLPMPRARARAVHALAQAMASGDVKIGPGMAPDDLRARLARITGVGPWTTAYVAMRALGDRRVHAGRPRGPTSDGRPRCSRRPARNWSPGGALAALGAYALAHLWAHRPSARSAA